MTITITEVRNAVSMNAANTRMDVEINHPQHGWIPYGLTDYDTDTTIDNASVMALIGTGFTAYVPPTQAELDAIEASTERSKRNDKLRTEVDPIASHALRWADLTSDKQTEWSQYRTALLDVPQQAGFPQTVTWPVQP